jgi:tetratricopeptide (TPR) repeat protein
LPRHQTLRATLDWSYRLLSEPDRIVLRRLAVFAGGFTLESAGRVVADATLPQREVVDRIAELVDKSLVVADTTVAGRRYRLLDTTHAYAMEKLADSGELRHFAWLHAQHIHEHLDDALSVWESTPSIAWLEKLGPEIDNVRVALDWAFAADGDKALGIEIAASSYLLLHGLSLMQEARSRLERAIAEIGAETPRAIEARLWYGYGFLSTGEPRRRAVPSLRRAVALFREVGEPTDLARALTFLGLNLVRTGASSEGLAALEEGRALLLAGAQPKSYAQCLTHLAIACIVAGEYAQAREWLDRALAIGQCAQADFWVWRVLIYKAEVEFAEGHAERAMVLAREVIDLCRTARRTGLLGHALCNLAGYLIEQGAIEEASAALREGLPLTEESAFDTALLAGGLQHLAEIAVRQNHLQHAAQFIGYAHAFFSAEFIGRSPAKRGIEENILARLRTAVPANQLVELMQIGAHWSEGEAMSVALRTWDTPHEMPVIQKLPGATRP